MKKLALPSLILATSIAYASSGAHASHELDEHQIRTIIYQTINVTILFIGLIYFAKKPIAKMLHEKKQAYVAAASKAEEVKKNAEKELYEMKVKLSRLEGTAEESVMRARAEAADLKKLLIEESQTISTRIKAEAEAAAKLEVEKAKQKIREEMIFQATEIAKTRLTDDLTQEDQKKLKTDFVKQVGGIHT